MGEAWQFWIDRGGTFTDIVARSPDGHLRTHKLLSEAPERYADAPIHGIRTLLGLTPGQPLDGSLVDAVKMGTTVATNALLERKGEPTLLVITEGFADQLRIAYQNRPHIFARHIVLPDMLYRRVIEVRGRLLADGTELTPLDEASAERDLRAAYADGFRSVAIVFMHSYRYPDHESRVAAIARRLGFTQVSVSHEVSPLMKMVSRGDTTVVDAYLSPILRRYVDQVSGALGGARLMFMQSNGGLTDAVTFQGKDSVLSGPAGGVVGAVRASEAAGLGKVIGFDMGGTSTDVWHYAGAFERRYVTEIAGVRLRAPMMHIHTIAAGGGSILHFDGSRYRVGPDSAGANPGPACYRRGGPLTVTDCNVMVGKIRPAHFPSVFGPRGDQPIDPEVVREKFIALADEIARATGERRSPEVIAEGFLKIAVENMANAIKKISVQRGYDVTAGYALCCFGAAAGQHACLVADALGMGTVFVHPYAGVLSAYGMGLADTRVLKERAVEAELGDRLPGELEVVFVALTKEGEHELQQGGLPPARVTVERSLQMRYRGTDSALLVPYGDRASIVSAFEERYRQRYGFVDRTKPLIIESAVVEVIGETEAAGEPTVTRRRAAGVVPTTVDQGAVHFADRRLDTPIYARDALEPGDKIIGPAIIIEPNSTTIVEPDWRAEVTPRNHLIMTRARPRERRVAIGTAVDPVMLEIFNNLFMSIAEQMGSTLENTAHSVNIKERLDFSCALFDEEGGLIANAPHMPVHLGSMGESVRSVLRNRRGTLKPGDVYVLNAPYNGGTHLPDVTVITPVFDAKGRDILFFTASRGHHADIGGITPGSMPPDSRTVEEEGVLIDNFQLVERGEFREAALRALLASGRYPSRNIDQNVADLKAQIAANEKGVHELDGMVAQFGLDTVQAYMRHVQDNAEESVRRVIGVLKDGRYNYPMDCGGHIVVDVKIDKAKRSARIDFTGTSAQLSSNFNAPSAVCRAAVLYVFRTLVDGDIPMNEGCLQPIELIIPKGSMLSPRYPAAVVAGNVETSQCITDALYGALGVLAGGQGTMNNFTFGNARHQYYETVSGGSGAGPDFDGTSVVQIHMTNSRLTDPEVLEWRFPVLLERFSIRRGSGGDGRHRGGDGAIRRVRFLEPMTAAILSNSRDVAPFGVAGGQPGQKGRNYVERTDGTITRLTGADRTEMNAGDVFVIESPGGGGFGAV
ncbi:MAG: 5-oxoprolinase [Alphaproteobacteria bacterium]|nr:5-oxoprolinase [Alphaproteobacteria bacterium]